MLSKEVAPIVSFLASRRSKQRETKAIDIIKFDSLCTQKNVSLQGFRLHLNHVKDQVNDISLSKVDESIKTFHRVT